MKKREGITMQFGLKVEGAVTSMRELVESLLLGSVWDVECIGPDGKKKWESLGNRNVMTNEGLNHALDVIFNGSTSPDPQVLTWYVAPFEDDYTPLAGDTYAVPGYTECTAYTEANRVQFQSSAAASQSLSNTANKATFNMNATKTVYGAGLIGGGTAAATKGDTAGGGVLLCAAKFSSAKPCENGDTLKITGTVNASNVA